MAEFDSPDSIGDDDDRNSNNSTDDRIDDDELDRLAQANAKLNASNLSEKPLESKGSSFPSVADRHTSLFFRFPAHIPSDVP